MTHSRRSFIKFGGAALGALATATLWPLRAFAAMVRPDAAFTTKDVPGILSQLGGTATESADIEFKTPDIAENGAVVPISVNSKIAKTEQIIVMVEGNPDPLSAIFLIPEGTVPMISTRIKVSKTCKLFAVVKADGKLYMTSKETKVTLGGCGG